jgi:peroxiredoxin
MVFPSPIKDIEMNLPTRLDLQYTIFLSDTTLEIFKLYQTRASLKGDLESMTDFKVVKEALQYAKWRSLAVQGKVFQLPSGFLINEDGVIELIKHGKNLTDILNPEAVIEHLETSEV